MKRVWVVLLVSLALFAALWGVRSFDASAEPSDEILAYQVGEQRAVVVTVSGGVPAVLINTWLLVPVAAIEPLFPYGIEVEVLDLDSNVLTTRRFETRSRPADTAQVSAARLADATAWVCEPRSFELDLAALQGRAGLLRVRALPGAHSTVLLRMTHRAERGPLEQRILERVLGQQEMRRIVAGRSSLGFFDLPLSQRMDALATWERRLTAQGSEGRDYFTRRLLLGQPARRARAPRWEETGLQTSPEQRLVLNLSAALHLRVHAPAGSEIVLHDTWDAEPSRHVAGEAGSVDVEFQDRGLRSVQIYTAKPARIALSASAVEGWLSFEPPQVIEGRYEVAPDVRKRNAYLLDPLDPITYSLDAAQKRVGVSLRALLEPGLPGRSIELRAVFSASDGRQLSEAVHRVWLELAPFERLGSFAVSERSHARLRVPEGATQVRFTAERWASVAAFVDEPGVAEEVLSPPYAQPPPVGLHWRYAPTELAPSSGIRPDNFRQLVVQQRELGLQAQVRLEPIVGVSADRASTLAERVLVPRSAPVERSLFSPLAYNPKAPAPDSAWLLLSTRSNRAALHASNGAATPSAVSEAASETLLEWKTLVPTQSLGATWSLLLNDTATPPQALALTSGKGTVRVPASSRSVQLLADKQMSLALRARPGGTGVAYKQQSVFELAPGGRLVFPFVRGAGQLPSLVVTLAAPSDVGSIALEFRVDGAEPRLQEGFFRRASPSGGQQLVQLGEGERGLVWDATRAGDELATDRLGRWVIALGDDLAEGAHEVELRLAAGSRSSVWVRAVVVGRVFATPNALPQRVPAAR